MPRIADSQLLAKGQVDAGVGRTVELCRITQQRIPLLEEVLVAADVADDVGVSADGRLEAATVAGTGAA